MKKLVVLMLAVAFLFVGAVKAQDANMPAGAESMTIKGTVMVTKDAENNITAVQLQTKEKGMYNITLDSMGKELGEKMDGKMVEITGKETTTDGQKWLTIEKYTEASKEY